MESQLNEVEARILGSLMEKALTTPEYYPLSVNAVVNACNQKSSRDPVVDYDAATVQTALAGLCEKDIVFESRLSRVPKYEEHFSRARQLVPREIAVLCLLLLRGPQTAGELRSRSTRMYSFDALEDVLATIDNLIEYGLARQLERLPGRKEPRYGQSLWEASRTPEQAQVSPEKQVPPEKEEPSDLSLRVDRMAQAIEDLQNDVAELKSAFDKFKKQFE